MPHEEDVIVQTDWSAYDPLPLVPANQFATQLGLIAGPSVPDGVLLFVGQAILPLFIGTPEETRDHFYANGGKMQVTPLAKYLVPRHRLQDLIDVLKNAADQYDAAVARGSVSDG